MATGRMDHYAVTSEPHAFLDQVGLINCGRVTDGGRICNRSESDPVHPGASWKTAYDGKGGVVSPAKRHADDDPVLFGYSSSENVTFNGENEESGYTWGQWRAMTEDEQVKARTDFLWTIAEVYVEDDES